MGSRSVAYINLFSDFVTPSELARVILTPIARVREGEPFVQFPPKLRAITFFPFTRFGISLPVGIDRAVVARPVRPISVHADPTPIWARDRSHVCPDIIVRECHKHTLHFRLIVCDVDQHTRVSTWWNE